MKYTLSILLRIGFFLLIIGMPGCRERSFDQRITLRKNDKIPYGSYAAFKSLPFLFPNARISVNSFSPEAAFLGLDTDSGGNLLVVISPQFYPSNEDLTSLFSFVEKGNDVFISSFAFNEETAEFFHFDTNIDITAYNMPEPFDTAITLELQLDDPPFINKKEAYRYNGRKYVSYFQRFDSSMSYLLGKYRGDTSNFIRLKAGKGSFFIHTVPIAFSNYFLLQHDNIEYFNQAMSLINQQVKRVIWDEYYLRKSRAQPREPNPLRILLAQPSFRWAIYTALAAVIVFVLLGFKRRQRAIPIIRTPRNDSLDFVKTVGRLYFQKKDHLNICQRMAGHFMEYVNARYKMHTGRMDEAFVQTLASKSGVEQEVIKAIVEWVQYFQSGSPTIDTQVIQFNQVLDYFYKKA